MEDKYSVFNESEIKEILHVIEKKTISNNQIQEIVQAQQQKNIDLEDLEEIARALIENEYKKEGSQIFLTILQDTTIYFSHRVNIAFDLFDMDCEEESILAWIELLVDEKMTDKEKTFIQFQAEEQLSEHNWKNKIINKLLDTTINLLEREKILAALTKIESYTIVSLLFTVLERNEMESVLRIQAVQGLISILYTNELQGFHEYDEQIKRELLKIIKDESISIIEREKAINELHKCNNYKEELLDLITDNQLESELREFSKEILRYLL